MCLVRSELERGYGRTWTWAGGQEGVASIVYRLGHDERRALRYSAARLRDTPFCTVRLFFRFSLLVLSLLYNDLLLTNFNENEDAS